MARYQSARVNIQSSIGSRDNAPRADAEHLEGRADSHRHPDSRSMSRLFIMLPALIFLAAAVADRALYGGIKQAQGHSDHVWKWYSNVRFQYTICYPEDLLVPEGESENGDGQRFLGKSGAQLIVYGRNNALDEQLRDVLAQTQSRLVGPSGKVTYKLLRSRWFVVTGLSGPAIFYAKTIYSHRQFKSFEITYERSWAAVYNPVIPSINSCFADLAQ
jgi:hypothetical protein